MYRLLTHFSGPIYIEEIRFHILQRTLYRDSTFVGPGLRCGFRCEILFLVKEIWHKIEDHGLVNVDTVL